jgi:hypothetical protein
MFSMSLGIRSRTTRGLAAAALILSLTATTYAGSANAAPMANTQACKVASQARNDAMSALWDAWKASSSDLKTLAKDTPALRHDLMGAWHDLRSVLMQAVADLKDLGLGSACQHENEDGAPTMGAVATTTDTTALEAQVKAIIDQAIKDLQAVVDAARKVVADPTAATEPKDSTASDEPKDSTDGANGDKDDKDSHDGNQAEDEDTNASNADKNEDGDNDHSSATSKAKSSNVAKATSVKKSTNLRVKTNGNHNGHRHERD